jgi:hypothetical protein
VDRALRIEQNAMQIDAMDHDIRVLEAHTK